MKKTSGFARLNQGSLITRRINIFCLREKGFTVNELKTEFNLPERTVWNIINKSFKRHGVLIKKDERFYINITEWMERIKRLHTMGELDIHIALDHYVKNTNKITINGAAKEIKVSKDKAKRLIEELHYIIKKEDKKRPYYVKDKEKLKGFEEEQKAIILNDLLKRYSK